MKKTFYLFIALIMLCAFLIPEANAIEVRPDTVLIDTTVYLDFTLDIKTKITGIAATIEYDTSQVTIMSVQKYNKFDVEIANVYDGRLEIAFNQMDPTDYITGNVGTILSIELYIKITDPNPGIFKIVSKSVVCGDKQLKGRWYDWNYILKDLIDIIACLRLR